jgi:hypothetical protein
MIMQQTDPGPPATTGPASGEGAEKLSPIGSPEGCAVSAGATWVEKPKEPKSRGNPGEFGDHEGARGRCSG